MSSYATTQTMILCLWSKMGSFDDANKIILGDCCQTDAIEL